ncbi:unnamed protein product [Vitrella brassicaformis CCMP3155]|uniref:Phosphatidate phosphatase APP1 catalytic domain-containing protein n=1 Tax=Vitrella brassicaformis (strain CCMP3155) TaxID=1169540 RepID=A0A0G4FSK8_VITBC|nr:unnamed protein product [Vitrella brassicaformis CCMP3155]|mmetsp:Transcript_53900/g.135451  ORF Transcript_53900/g.135451 Transcript_53900/m.135451 type:complete len:406 (-) Transcript_53900:1482-2699(-)|eukprot:CEM17650.1 unnamed protein product [Vitrella brassicaformis CCMP3155]
MVHCSSSSLRLTLSTGMSFMHSFVLLLAQVPATNVPRCPPAFLVPWWEKGALRQNGSASRQWNNVQVVVDVDDTIKSSGGWRILNIPIGGIDTQYDRGVFYPGASQFVFELATHQPRPSSPPRKIGNSVKPLPLAVLTARIPQVPIKRTSTVFRRFREIANENNYAEWGIDLRNGVLYSTLKQWVFQWTKGDRKFENFELLKQRRRRQFGHDKVKYVWVGDTGEMDREAGEMMARKHPESILAVFLHYVSERHHLPAELPEDYSVNGTPIYFFRTYIGAASKAAASSLISGDSLVRVVNRAVKDLDRMNVRATSSKWRDLRMDFEEAERLLGPWRKFRDPAWLEAKKALEDKFNPTVLADKQRKGSSSGSRTYRPVSAQQPPPPPPPQQPPRPQQQGAAFAFVFE